MKKIYFLLLVLILFAFPIKTSARDNITDWYIQKLDTKIVVNKDSTADITEDITADCGNLPDKHGIFRVLPTLIYKNPDEGIFTPVELQSITDFNNRPLIYEETKSSIDHTVTWKIGDPNTTVTGVNYYRIKYRVKNVVRFDDANVDKFLWNVNGAFWELQIDQFKADVVFPTEINQQNTKLVLFSGDYGSTGNDYASSIWVNSNTIEVTNTKSLLEKQGITLSLDMPKNIFTPYNPTLAETFGNPYIFILPILSLILCFFLWYKYGRDPHLNNTIVPEFEIPEDLCPMDMCEVLRDGILVNKAVTASIVNLAVKGKIKITKIDKKSILGKDDYALTIIDDSEDNLAASEVSLKKKLFAGNSAVNISSLKDSFYTDFVYLQSEIKNTLAEKKLVYKNSRVLQVIFLILGIGEICLGFYLLDKGPFSSLAVIVSGLTFFIFSFVMPRRTIDGMKLRNRIEGFKLYMNTAEKYRQQFNEKENIYEKYLPYAILFGITDLWAEKMKQIYGQNYLNSYTPIWYVGSGQFNFDNFSANLNALTSSMASTMSSGGGGGFSGGGGGGGGGGGW